MATATIVPGTEERTTGNVAEWVSQEVIEYVDSLQTDVECRAEAFASRLSTKITEAALRGAQDCLATLMVDLRGRTASPMPPAAEQKVLPLTKSDAQTSTPPAKSGARRAPRDGRAGGIANEVTAYLSAHPEDAFTASAIAKALDGNRSSGAVDAAMKRMLDRGEIVLVSASPRKYQLAKR